MKVIKEIPFNFGKAQLLENGIVRLEMFENTTIGENESRLMNNAIGVLRERKESLVMIVPHSSTHFTHDARDFSASEEGLQYTIADAMVVTDLAQKLLVSFYLKFNKPKKTQ